MSVAILSLRTQASTVGKSSLEAVEIGAPDIRVLIDDEASQALPRAGAHDSRFAMMNLETFFAGDCCNMGCEALNSLFESIVPGKGKVVSVPGVGSISRRCKSG